MSSPKETSEVENCGFKWGKKRGSGGEKKEVHFYESCTYDGEEYFLYDSVYLYKDGEPEPYIGKIIKMWQMPSQKRRVKILWFFRPIEIINYLGDNKALPNELFLASGEGRGLFNINPLEAIAGKCNVVCTSKNDKNPQPSEEELRMSDYIFYRTFNVGTHVISETIDEKIAGIQDKFIYKRNEGQKSTNIVKLDIGRTEENEKVVGNNEVSQLPLKSASPEVTENSVRLETPDNIARKADEHLIAPVVKQDPSPGAKLVSHSGLESNEIASPIIKQENALTGTEIPIRRAESDEGKVKTGEVSISQVQDKEKLKSVNGLNEKHGASKKSKLDNSVNTGDISINQVQKKEKLKSVDGLDEKDRPSKKSKLDNPVNTGDVSVSQVQNKEKLKSVNGLDENDTHSKKAKLDSSVKSSKGLQPSISTSLPLNKDKNEARVQKKLIVDSDEDDVGPSETVASASEDIVGNSPVPNKDPPKKVRLDEKKVKLSNGKLSKPAASSGTEKDINTDGQTMEVSKRPIAGRSKWFKDLPWEERMQTAHDQGTLVLLENLDPAYTSSEVEDIIWRGFKESCTAKIVPKTAISCPHSGQALVIFKSRDAAEMAINKLDEGCLMLPNGRPLVASRGSPPKLSGKPSTLVGHLFIDKIKLQTQREEIKRAVSTSHCSQPNTIEYDMALEWCLLQARADKWWKELYKLHGDEMRKLRSDLKSK